MGFFRFVNGILDRLCAVAGAFVGSQIPVFMQQYTQRLAGQVDELTYLLNKLRHLASLSGKTLDQYIKKFAENSDPDFSRQGEFMNMILMRWQESSEALYTLQQSTIWSRPYNFAKYFNYDIAEPTYSSFQPGINLTLEGLCYTGVGLLIGYLIYQIISKSIEIGYTRAAAIFKQNV